MLDLEKVLKDDFKQLSEKQNEKFRILKQQQEVNIKEVCEQVQENATKKQELKARTTARAQAMLLRPRAGGVYSMITRACVGAVLLVL